MKDRRLNSNGEIEEWERPGTIPDDFIYDPETHSYYASGEPSMYNAQEAMRELLKTIEEIRREPPIPVEQLQVPAGTLDVPPAWRKSLRRMPERERQRDLFTGLIEDDDPGPAIQQSTRIDPDPEEIADEVG